MIRHAICILSVALASQSPAHAQDASVPSTTPPAVVPATTCPEDQPYCEFSQLIIKPGAPGTGLRSYRRTPGITINGLRPIDRNALRLPNASVGMVPAAPAVQ
jgi:hypothetical protein